MNCALIVTAQVNLPREMGGKHTEMHATQSPDLQDLVHPKSSVNNFVPYDCSLYLQAILYITKIINMAHLMHLYFYFSGQVFQI